MMEKYLKNNNGYIALVSAVIISMLLLVIIFSLNLSSFFGRFNVFDSTTKEMSHTLAEACAEKALLNLAQNSSYLGNENVAVNEASGEECDILPIEISGSQKIIKLSSTFQKTTTNIKIIVNSADFSIALWEEVSKF